MDYCWEVCSYEGDCSDCPYDDCVNYLGNGEED